MSERKNYARRVMVTAAIYTAAAWGAVEALLTIVDRFGLPVWLGTLITALFLAGLPVTAYLVWRTAGPERRASLASVAGSLLFLAVATTAIYWVSKPQQQPPARLVAVLPCAFSGDAALAYRAEGLAEDVHARLERVDALRVSSWNSSLFVHEKGYLPGQIAELLKADRLVTCRMKTSQERVDLAAEVIDPLSNRVLWTRNFDFAAADLGSVVTELAGALLNVLTVRAEAGDLDRLSQLGTFSAEAYDLYLQAGASAAPDGQEELLRAALAIDPNYAKAMVRLAQVYMQRFTSQEFQHSRQPHRWATEARALSERALAVDPGVYGARMALAIVCDWLGAYYAEPCPAVEPGLLLRAECEVRGDTAEGWACRHRLAHDGSREDRVALERWLELEPTSIEANMQYIGVLWRQDSPAEALAVFDIVRFLAPDDPRPYGIISNLLRVEGRLDEVLAWRYGAWDGSGKDNPWTLARLATDYLNLGLYEQSLEFGLRSWETRRASAMHFLPWLWLHFGEAQKAGAAMEWLSETLAEMSGGRNGRLEMALYYADALRDWDRSAENFRAALEFGDLVELCEDEECTMIHLLCLAHVERMLGRETEGERWLDRAEALAETTEPSIGSTVYLRVVQGRHDEAVGILQEAVLGWALQNDENELEFPLLRLEQSALLDPLRDHPGFRQLLVEYEARLAPMRNRAAAANDSGDWSKLRLRSYDWANGTLE